MLTDLFFGLNCAFIIFISIFGMILCFIIILIVATNQQCHTVTNLLTCNTAMASAVCLMNTFIVCFYTLREDWARNQPICRFRAYSFLLSCGTICYSYTLQAISRLFLTVFSKHKHLASYRTHWYLIALNWIIPMLLSMVPFFINDAFTYENESRLCILTSKKFWISAYSMIAEFVLPFNITSIIYITIVFHIRSSTRISSSISNSFRTRMRRLKREIKVVNNMMILLVVFSFGGIPYLSLIIWQGLNPHNLPPESFYLLSIQAIPLGIVLKLIVILRLNKQVSDIILRRHERVHSIVTSDQLMVVDSSF